MDAATRATLEGWRNEITAEIEVATADLAASSAALRAAEENEAAEKIRVAGLIAARAKLAGGAPLANALRHRLEAAARISPGAATRGHTEAVAAAEFRLTDLRDALDQLAIMLQPPAPPVLALVDTRQAAPARGDGFDPIVPARAIA